MRNWSKDGEIPPLDQLLLPLRKVIFEGYSIERNGNKTFVYMGYNIGASDQLYNPTPDERFSSRWLSNEEKFVGRTLIDNVLMVAYQYGVEAGRRLSNKTQIDQEFLYGILASQTNRINKYAEQLSHSNPLYAKLDIPLEMNDDSVDIDSKADGAEEVEEENEEQQNVESVEAQVNTKEDSSSGISSNSTEHP